MDTKRTTSSINSSVERSHFGRIGDRGAQRIFFCMVILVLIFGGQVSHAQGIGISESSITPDASAILELRYSSGPYKGFLVPRMTSANRTSIGSPATGLMVYDTDVKSFHYYDGGWIAIPGGNSIVGPANGGTGQSTYTIGDILYASASTTVSKLADVAAGSYLRSGGVATAPSWSTLTLSNSATTGDLFYASGSNAMGNLADVAVGRVLISGGAGLAPSYSATPSLGVAGSTLGTLAMSGNTSGTVTILPQAAAGTYNFNLPTAAGSLGQPLLSGGGGASAMSFGTLGAAAGGTGQTAYSVGDMLYASAATTLLRLADVTVGSYLRSGGVTTPPLWSTLTLPNSATTGDLFYASGSNAMGNLTDVALGRVLISGGVGVAPSYSATPTLGVAGSTLGTLAFAGNTSGAVNVQPQAAAGTYNFNLPATAGTASQVLLSGGGVAAPMTWATLGGAASITANATATAATTVLTGATWTMPIGLATVGMVIRIRCNFRFVHTAAATPTLTCNLNVAGGSVASFVISPIATAGTYGGYIEGEVTIITIGAPGSLMSSLMGSNSVGITNATNWNPQSVNIVTSPITTTAANVISLTMNMTTAVAGNTLTISQGWVEVIKP